MSAMPNDLYPIGMIERFARVVAALPVGTCVDFMGVPAVVTGHQMLPARPGVTLPHMATKRDNSKGVYFVLHMNRLAEDKILNGTMMTLTEAEKLAETEIMRTPEEWSVLDDITVHDPDGWRFGNRFSDGVATEPKDWTEPITREEWEYRMGTSTVGPRRK